MAKKSIASTNIRIGVSTAGLTKGLARAQKSLKNFGASAKRIGSTINKSVTLPFAVVGTAGVKMALDLEKSFATIENLVGVTGKALDDFKSSVKEVSAQTGQSQQELADAIFTVSSAGLRGAQATEVLERAAKASSIGLGDTKSIAQALTGVMQAYSKSGLTAAAATDTLTAIVREGNLEAESLAPTLGGIVGLDAQLGIGFDELGANIATFTRLGVSAEEAVTGLKGVMTTFVKPTEKAKKALESIGMTSSDLRDRVGKDGLQATLGFLLESFEGNEEALTGLFGNVRALSNVLGTAGAQGEAYAEVLNNIKNATGIVDDGFENVSNTAGFKLNKAFNDLKNVGTELGATLLPIVTKVATFVKGVIEGFNSLTSETKTQIVSLIAVVAASGPIMTAIGFIASALGALLSPVGLVIAGVALAGYAIFKFWDDVKPIFVKIANAWIELYNESLAFRASVQFLVFVFKSLWDGIKVVFENIIGGFKNIANLIVGIFSLDRAQIAEALSGLKNGFAEVTSEIGDTLSENWQEMLDNLNPREKIELVTEEGLQEGVDKMKDFLLKKWEGITSMFTWGGISNGAGGGDGTGGGGGGNDPDDPDPNGETEKKLTNLGKAWQKYGVQVQGVSEQMAQAITGMVDEVVAEGIMRLGESLVLGGEAFEGFGVFVLGAFSTMAQQLGSLAISIGFAISGIQAALTSLNPTVAIAAGVALLALAGVARGKMKQIAQNKEQVKLAKGGLAYGETMALVGDNPNARMDPEVIAPLSKLKSMLSETGGAVEVYGRLSGQDILLSTEKAGRTRSRYRGF